MHITYTSYITNDELSQKDSRQGQLPFYILGPDP